MLTNLHRRVRLLGDAGIDAVFVLPFSRDISEWSPEEFVQRLLVDTLHAVHVVVGANFRFGHKQAGDVEALTTLGGDHGFTVDATPLLEGDGTPVSSTWIRGRLADGDVAALFGLEMAENVGPNIAGPDAGRPSRSARPVRTTAQRPRPTKSKPALDPLRNSRVVAKRTKAVRQRRTRGKVPRRRKKKQG